MTMIVTQPWDFRYENPHKHIPRALPYCVCNFVWHLANIQHHKIMHIRYYLNARYKITGHRVSSTCASVIVQCVMSISTDQAETWTMKQKETETYLVWVQYVWSWKHPNFHARKLHAKVPGLPSQMDLADATFEVHYPISVWSDYTLKRKGQKLKS